MREEIIGNARLILGDCREALAGMEPNSLDACVTDPPYELGFMGRAWDRSGVAFDPATWAAVLRVLKPGAHLVAFGAPRNYHRLACAIEDAGFEVRDSLMWLFGSGFPKSHDVSKGIDKRRNWEALPRLQEAIGTARKALGISQSEAARRMGLIEPGETLGGGGFMWFETGMRAPTREQWPRLKSALAISDEFDECFEEAEREVTGTHTEWTDRVNYAVTSKDGLRRDKPASDAALQWQGWGTALKPAHEPIVHGTKPVTVRQHFAMVVEELTIHLAEALSWLDCNASGVPKSLSGIRAKWSGEASSVLDGARMRSLASIGIAPYAARSSTFSGLGSLDLTRTKDCSALSHVSQFGSKGGQPGQITPHGAAADIQTLIMDMSTSAVTGDISQNIASSWERISDVLWSGSNTFTIETAIRLTIALRTLSFSLSQNTTAATGRLTPDATPIILARKPLIGTVAANVLAHGTGAINIDGCRVGAEERTYAPKGTSTNAAMIRVPERRLGTAGDVVTVQGRWPANIVHDGSDEVLAGFPVTGPARSSYRGLQDGGRHGGLADIGANIKAGTNTLRGVDDAGGSAARFFAAFPFVPAREGAYGEEWYKQLPANTAEPPSSLQRASAASALALVANSALPEGLHCTSVSPELSTSETASELSRIGESVTQAIQSIGPRFWLASEPLRLSLTCSHASVAAAHEPTGITTITVSHWKSDGSAAPVTFSITPQNSEHGARGLRLDSRFKYCAKASAKDRAGSKHPTVKPVALMRWLVRLVTPPGGRILDPFAGSGTTGQAAGEEGFDALLIEREPEYAADIRRRLSGALPLFAAPAAELQEALL